MISTSKKRGGIQRQCLTCGMEFWAWPSRVRKGGGKFCSPACRARNQIACEPRLCITCGKKFQCQPSRIRRGRDKFCSQVCHYQNRITRETCTCGACGKEFERKPSSIRRKGDKFCSPACRVRSQITRETRVCLTCGKEFQRLLSHIRQHGGNFCSKACIRRNDVKRGREHPTYKHGQSGTPEYVRAAAAIRRTRKRNAGGTFTVADIKQLEIRQHFRCRYCACSIKHRYHIDHIQPISRGGSSDPKNLQLLCPTCNMRKSNLTPEKFAQKMGLLL